MSIQMVLVRFYTFDSIQGLDAQIEHLGEEIGLLEYALHKPNPVGLSFEEEIPAWAQHLTIALLAQAGFIVGIIDPTIGGTVLTSGNFIPGVETDWEYQLGALR